MKYNIMKMEEALDALIDYRGKTPQKSETGIMTLSAKSVKNNYIDYSQCYYISKEEYQRFMVRGFPQKGDVLLTTEAPLGMVARLDRDDIAIAQRYQNEELIALTKELTEMLRKNRTIDWQKKETARAQMRKMVKRLLKKYKYPPEDYEFAINTVISQCELWTDNVEPRKEEKLYKFVSERELGMVAESSAPYGKKQ